MNKVPKLRFRGFEGEWEEKPLKNFFTKVTTKNTSLEYTTVLTNSAELGVIPQSDYFTFEVANSNSIGNYYIVQPDDFVYNPRVSVTAPVGPIKQNKLGYTGIMSPLYLVFKISDINKDFLSYYFETSNWHQFMRLSGNSGARFDRISMSDDTFVQMPIKAPSLPEQRRIASYFTHLDTLIEASRQKVEKYKQVKAASLQALFPQNGERAPKLRFKGFEGEWKTVELGDVLLINSGRDYKHLKEGNIPVYGTGGYMLSVNKSLSSVDAIGIGRKGTIDRPQYLKAPFWTVDTLFFLTAKRKDNLRFLFALAQNIDWKRYDESTGVPSLSKSNIETITFQIPSLSEQHLIAKYFTNLNSLLSLEQQRYEKLQQVKRASLSQMFV